MSAFSLLSQCPSILPVKKHCAMLFPDSEVFVARPVHEDGDEEEETVVEDDAELTIDKLNDELAVRFLYN